MTTVWRFEEDYLILRSSPNREHYLKKLSQFSTNMKNPYKVLNLSQNATAAEIAKSQIFALRAKKYSMKEITEAQTTLRKPSTRLAADFTFPILDEEVVEHVTTNYKSKPIDFNSISANKYDSLK